MAPRHAVYLHISDWPKEGSWKKTRRMCWDVHEYVERPGEHFPERPLSDDPDDRENHRKNNEAMSEVIHRVNIFRDEQRIGWSIGPVHPRRETKRASCRKNSEGEEIWSNSENERKPEAAAVRATKSQSAPESVRKSIHSPIVPSLIQNEECPGYTGSVAYS